jgi:FkbM family methyltransferase
LREGGAEATLRHAAAPRADLGPGPRRVHRQLRARPLPRGNGREHPLTAKLRRTYGPSKSGSNVEEWIIRDFFKDERGGVFVDVGANHYQEGNNSYYLETALDWSGVAVEPQIRFADGYKQSRPRTTFVPLFVSDVGDADATLWVPTRRGNAPTASGSREFAQMYGPVVAQQVKTITMDTLLERLDIRRFDFLSMDIEQFEPQALAGFSITRFAPRLVGIEAHDPVMQQLLEYFSRHGYVLIGKYLDVDDDNFWFAPAGLVRDQSLQERGY